MNWVGNFTVRSQHICESANFTTTHCIGLAGKGKRSVSGFADSAGVPWDGRAFSENPFADDDGSANPALIEALAAFRANPTDPRGVFKAFAASRLLIPLLADLGESGEGAHGQTVDKSADLSIVTVETPDGQTGLPVFSSVAAMSVWNKTARPVPAASRSAAGTRRRNRCTIRGRNACRC